MIFLAGAIHQYLFQVKIQGRKTRLLMCLALGRSQLAAGRNFRAGVFWMKYGPEAILASASSYQFRSTYDRFVYRQLPTSGPVQPLDE